MSMKYLGESFDIHTGGVDLIFPHHENEIAQSEAANREKFVNYWLHNEWILVNGKKMSKSLGNFYKLKDIIEKGYSPLDLRYFYLTKSYKQQLNFTWKNLKSAKNSLGRLKNIISGIKKSSGKINKKNIERAKKQFLEFMDDNLNTSRGISYLWEILREDKLNDLEKHKLALEFDKVFGLRLDEEEKIKIPKEVQGLIKKRGEYRKKNDWKKADELRKKINKLGYKIDDTPEGVVVKRM